MLQDEMRIVEYDPIYAKCIAEMWNNSGSGWNGDNTHYTEAGVRDKEAVSSYLHLYLAFIGDKVVGYCKLSKYFYDENTLYIDLLNVDPQYHNMKIGKALVKKSVERTIELGYPRLDLFTWAGNTKAVPLYKKCGFFWEKMEANSTHLMNFIPAVFNTALIKDYFTSIDWYDDSTRTIDIVPDGRTENNFDFLTYCWEKDGRKLVVEFEKTGRGIHSIDTDEFQIVTEIENGKLVFGRKYKVKYDILNKTGKAQKVEIKGIDDKNIKFDLNFSGEVLGNKTIEGEFYLGSIDFEQSMWNTHPAVCAEITFNGKSAIFKTGINPQFPLRMFAGKMENSLYTGRKKELFVNVENNFNEDGEFEIIFPKQKDIHFGTSTIKIPLEAHQRSNFPIKVTVRNSVLYNQRLEVRVHLKNGESFSYSQPYTMIIYIPEGRTYGKNNEKYSIINGKNVLILNEDDDINTLFYKVLNTELHCYIGYPKIGKPYSSEFLHKQPDKIEIVEKHYSVTLKMYYSSDSFPGLKFISHNKVCNSGMLEQWFEILSYPDGCDEIYLNRSVIVDNENMTIPYSGMIIKTDTIAHNDNAHLNWDGDKINENWLYFTNKNDSMSIVWHKKDRLVCCEWYYAIEYTLKKGKDSRTHSLFIGYNVFSSVKELREFALRKKVEPVIPKSFHDLIINRGNPFVDGKCKVAYTDYRQTPMDCTVNINSENGICPSLNGVAEKDKEKHELRFEFKAKSKSLIDIVKAEANYPTRSFHIEKTLFQKQKGEVHQFTEKIEDHTVYTVDNGLIRFKVSPGYAPAVYSLVYQDHEWLDNSFPTSCSKSWWNPWYGGVENNIEAIKRSSWIEEKHIIAFVEKADNYGQIWKGIEIKTAIENYDSHKNLVVSQYFLVLTGLPVMAVFSSYFQESGFCRELTGFSRIFAKGDDEITNSTFELTRDGEVFATNCGIEEIDFNVLGKLLACAGKNRREKLYFYNTQSPFNAHAGSDSSTISLLFYHHLSLKNNECKATPIKFIILSELDIPEKTLIDLESIRF